MPNLDGKASVDWDATVGIGKARRVDPGILHFDAGNPRFTLDKRPAESTDEAIVVELARSADLSELVQSIGYNGYFNIEPLIVVVRDEKLVVLEGNRRLAALKVLNDSKLARRAKLSIPEIRHEVRSSMEEILVYRVEREKDARKFIGYKHINGSQSWDAFAKARFVANWLDDKSGPDEPLSLADIAIRVGDSYATIHRMVTAYNVLMQAEREDVFCIRDRYMRSFSFSHLYTSLTYTEFTNYIGMPRLDRKKDPSRNPVGKEKMENLKCLLSWLYGSKETDVQPVVRSQYPDLVKLRDVLSSKSAIQVLMKTRDLENAQISTMSRSSLFANHIAAADSELHRALDVLDGFDAKDQLELQEIVDSATSRMSVIKNRVDTEIANSCLASGGD